MGVRAHPRHSRAPSPRGHGEPLDADQPRGAARATPNMPPRRGAAPGDITRGRAGVPTPGQQDQRATEEGGNVRKPGGVSGAASPEAYVPVAMNLRHAQGEGPSRSPTPGWALDIHEAELSFEPPPSPADVPNSGSPWLQLTLQGHAYTDHGSQVNQDAMTAMSLRMADPPQEREGRWEQHGGSPTERPSSRRAEQGLAWR